jgi:hypothetical protein
VIRFFQGPYKAVTEAKETHIKVNIFEPQLGNNNNHQKKVEAENTLSKSNAETEEERGTNTNPITNVSTKWSNYK